MLHSTRMSTEGVVTLAGLGLLSIPLLINCFSLAAFAKMVRRDERVAKLQVGYHN